MADIDARHHVLQLAETRIDAPALIAAYRAVHPELSDVEARILCLEGLIERAAEADAPVEACADALLDAAALRTQLGLRLLFRLHAYAVGRFACTFPDRARALSARLTSRPGLERTLKQLLWLRDAAPEAIRAHKHRLPAGACVALFWDDHEARRHDLVAQIEAYAPTPAEAAAALRGAMRCGVQRGGDAAPVEALLRVGVPWRLLEAEWKHATRDVSRPAAKRRLWRTPLAQLVLYDAPAVAAERATERALALAMAMHARLGAASPLARLDPALVATLCDETVVLTEAPPRARYAAALNAALGVQFEHASDTALHSLYRRCVAKRAPLVGLQLAALVAAIRADMRCARLERLRGMAWRAKLRLAPQPRWRQKWRKVLDACAWARVDNGLISSSDSDDDAAA